MLWKRNLVSSLQCEMKLYGEGALTLRAVTAQRVRVCLYLVGCHAYLLIQRKISLV